MKLTLSIFLFFITFHCLYSQDSNSDLVLINDTTDTFLDLEEILQFDKLKNKVVYVDIWDTGCKPCLKEFTYSDQLKQEFKNDSVVFLYLCARNYTTRKNNTRDLENENRWKKMIVEKQLKGIHVLLSNTCYVEGFLRKYEKEYIGKLHYCVPQFLLVNKQGEIVNFNASRPSQGEVLYAEIRELLK